MKRFLKIAPLAFLLFFAVSHQAFSFESLHPTKGVSTFTKGGKYAKKLPLPGLDSTRKLHGAIPNRNTLNRLGADDLLQLRKDAKLSVKERIRVNSERGYHRPHGQRQAQEQQLTKDIDRILSTR